MRWREYIDPDEVQKAIAVLQAPDDVFEVRIIGTSSGRKDILSGYFRDAETLLQNFDKVDVRGRNIYITLGRVKEECFARSQSEHFERNPSTTSDPEIESYRWFFVDLDPVRPAGISSSDSELNLAKELADKVYEYLGEMGFREPVKAISGNGYHLLYRIDIKNDTEGRSLIEKCLKYLSLIFDTDKVKIDTTNSNPSRICKLHGTLAQKGTSTKNRPHRMSRLLSVPDPIEVTDRGILQTLVADLPEDPKPSNRKTDSRSQAFDLVEFLQRNGITYTEGSDDRAKIFRLDECPFDHNHRNGDAKIFLYHDDGAIAFKCHHNSCRGRKWQDVRMLFEPDAYDREKDDERIDAGYQEHKRKQAEEANLQADQQKPEQQKKKRTYRRLKKANDLMKKNLPEPKVYVGVDSELPLLVEGTCILSAKPKLGKSWLALALCLAVANGEDFLEYHTRKCSALYLDLETSETLQQKRLKKMLHGNAPPENFYLDTETDTLENGFVDQIEHYMKEDPDIGVVVIDVFQIIRSVSKNSKETEYEHAYRDITPLNELAQKYHISIILVCHDRKAVDPDDPFSNILGSTGLQGAATQMMVMFRKRKEDPIHISVKGKTIDGLPELNVSLDDARWSIVAAVDTAGREEEELMHEFRTSMIRIAVADLAKSSNGWKGRCGQLINDAIDHGIALTASAKNIGLFLHKHRGRFLAEDNINIRIIDNGSGPKIYELTKAPLMTIDTIDKNQELPLMEFEDASKYGASDIPFL